MALYLTSCNNTTQNETIENQAVTETADSQNDTTDNAIETKDVDAVSSATNVANVSSFNGIFVVPPQQQVTVSLTMGGIVKNTSILEGQYIKKGEIIAILDNPEFIDLQQNFLETAAQLEYMEKEFLRQQNLVSQEAASQKQYQQSKSEYLSVKSKAEAMSSKLYLLGVDINILKQNGMMPRLEVKSPISGYVTNANINIGKYINPGEAICDIIDKSNLLLQLTAYEKDLSKIKIGDIVEFQVNGAGDQLFKAELISIDQKVDDNNRSIKVFAKLIDKSPIFRPGMYINAKVTKKQ